MRIKVELEVPNTYTKGCCYDCPFSYQQDYEDEGYLDFDNVCVFHSSYDKCPVEIVKEKPFTSKYRKTL